MCLPWEMLQLKYLLVVQLLNRFSSHEEVTDITAAGGLPINKEETEREH